MPFQPPKGVSQERKLPATGNQFLDSLLGFVLPQTPRESLEAVFSPIPATIAPATWRAMSPHAKAMLTQLADAFPESFARVLAAPRELMAFVGKLDPGIVGRLTRSELPGVGKAAQAVVTPLEARKLQTPAHEIFGHFLADDSLAKTAPRAQEIFGMLEDVLPLSTTGSLRMRTQQLRDLRNLNTENLSSAVSDISKKVPGVNPNAIQNFERDLQRVIMDEALGSLAEAQTLPNVSPLVRQLAEGLGVVLK